MFEVSGDFAQMFNQIGKGHEDEKFSREVVATWVAFAATGYDIRDLTSSVLHC